MKQLFLLLLACTSLQAVRSQDWSGNIYVIGKIYPGFYVTNEGDTVNGYFYHGNQTGNQKNCLFYTNETDRKPTKTFGTDDIKSYKVGDKLYRSIHFSGGLFPKPLRFNLVVKDGAITEYVFYAEDGSGSSEPVFHKPHDPDFEKPITTAYFGLSYAKKMSKYVADYADLSEKVANKEKGYGVLALQAVIAEYNDWYAKQKK
jgi:hypothetical protein